MRALSLHHITAANWRATLGLSVHPEQQRFVAGYTPIAAIILAKAYVRAGGFCWEPYAIATEPTIVGLFALAYQPDSADVYWLYHFFIDRQYQGQGYGAAALGAIIDMVAQQHPHCRQISLTVHPENGRAQQLYTRFGFERTEASIDEENVYRCIIPSAAARCSMG